jgi:hypothetical protein
MSTKTNVGSAVFIVAQLEYYLDHGHPFNRLNSLLVAYGGTITDYWGNLTGATFVLPATEYKTPVVYAMVCSPPLCRMYLNDPNIVRTTAAFDGSAYETDVWMRYWTTNILAELRLYEGIVSDTQRVAIFDELKAKWGTPQ